MTECEKKKWLEEYRASELEIQHLQREMAEMERRMQQVRELCCGDVFLPGCMGVYQKELQERLARGMRVRQDIARAIGALPDARLRGLLQMRYMEGFTIAQTAEKMAYSTRQVDNLILSALRGLKLPKIS